MEGDHGIVGENDAFAAVAVGVDADVLCNLLQFGSRNNGSAAQIGGRAVVVVLPCVCGDFRAVFHGGGSKNGRLRIRDLQHRSVVRAATDVFP